MAACISSIDQCVVRGDTYPARGVSTLQSLELVNYPEVWENPADYVVAMVFKEAVDDALPVLLELTATPEALPIDKWTYNNQPTVTAEFSGTTEETAALPPHDIQAYCELRTITPGGVTRLFNSKVKVTD